MGGIEEANMENPISFRDYAIVSCGTLVPELSDLKAQGFLDARKVLYTKPGRHEIPRELESQLIERIHIAQKHSEKIIVVYGGTFCYVNVRDPCRTIDTVIQEQGQGISRIDASHCIDMLASAEEREAISEGQHVCWLTPGWIKYSKFVYQDWDQGKANENFPRHDGGAVVLDGIGYFDELTERDPERLLALSDWMGIPIDAHRISLDRLKALLSDCVISDLEAEVADLESRLPAHSVKPTMIAQVEELEDRLERARAARGKLGRPV